MWLYFLWTYGRCLKWGMSAINSPGACLSLDNKVVLLGGAGFPISWYFDLWGKYEPGSSLMGTFYQEYKKAFCCDWHTKGAKRNSGGCDYTTLNYFLTPESKKGQRQGKDCSICSWPNVAWRFNRRSWFLMPCPCDPEFSLWTMLTLVCQGHKQESRKSEVRWGSALEGKILFQHDEMPTLWEIAFFVSIFHILDVNMACHSSEML